MADLINEHIGLFVISSEQYDDFVFHARQPSMQKASGRNSEESLQITENGVYIRAMDAALAHEVLEGDELARAFAELRERLPHKQLLDWLVPRRLYAGDDLGQLRAALTHVAAERADHAPMQRVIASALSLIERAQARGECFLWALGYDWEEEVLDEAAQAERDAENERVIQRLDAFIEKMDMARLWSDWSRTEVFGGVLLYLVDPTSHAEIHATRAQGLALHEAERDDEGLEYRERVLAMAREAAIETVRLRKLGEQAALEELQDMLFDELPDVYQETGAYTNEQARVFRQAIARWEKRAGGEAGVVKRIASIRHGHDKRIARRAYRTFKRTLSRAIKRGMAFVWLVDYTT